MLYWKMTVNGKTFVTSRHDILGRIKKVRGREYYLNDGKIIEHTKNVVGTWKVHGCFEDQKCTKRVKEWPPKKPVRRLRR